MFLIAFLSVVGLGFLCWVMFNLAVYALPFFAGVSIGMAAHNSGAGVIGAIAIGLFAGALTLVLGQILLATIRSPVLRFTLTFAYAAPAALAGYSVMHGLTGIGGTADGWRQIFGIIGAVIVALVAWSRMNVFQPGDAGQGVWSAQSQVVGSGAPNDR